MGNLSFIILDDSELDCFIANKIIRQSGVSGSVKSFLQAKDMLKYLQSKELSDQEIIVILLDIIMPVMSGFDFLDEFKSLPEAVRNRCYIIAITSSMNKKYTGRIPDYLEVRTLIDKPITREKFQVILDQIASLSKAG